jgi:WS/DGAT/MGAT family acyltransferase
MGVAYHERLSALDASFLAIEDASSHMHVAATMLFDGGPLRRANGGLDMERVREYIASRLHLIPRYRQRLAYVPFERHPVWVDDERFNVFYHVRHTSLPRPGAERQLKRLCGRILSQKLDATKPLWEIWVVEGLANETFAMVAKVHHCMVDGISGMGLLAALLSPTAEGVPDAGPRWVPRPVPAARELLAAEIRRRVGAPLELLAAGRRALRDPLGAATELWEGVQGLLEAAQGAGVPASPTPLNPPCIGPHRRFDWLRMDLGAVKAVKTRLGGTVNDVVLATVAGGFRSFLTHRGMSVEAIDFRAMVPVSVRHDDERGRLGNRVSQLIVPLPVGEPDLRRRYRAVLETTRALKGSRQARGGELLEEIGNWTTTGVLSQFFRLAARRRPYNVVVTNVPGPSMPLYLLGAPMRAPFPMVPLFANQAVGIALFSYTDGLFWGVSADWDEVPDLHELVEALAAAFCDLERLAESGASAA